MGEHFEAEGKKETVPDQSVEDLEREKNLQRVFQLNPELATIGSSEQYRDYLQTVFPESVLRGEILWHGNTEDFKDADFVKGKGRTSVFTDDGAHYGFYFGDYYSHYGAETEPHGNRIEKISYPVILNTKNPRYIRPGVDKGTSSIDMRKNIKDQYGIVAEDSIVTLGPHFLPYSDLYTKEEFKDYERGTEKQFQRYLVNNSKNPEEFDPTHNDDDWEMALRYVKEHGVLSVGLTELVVFEPSQIHILGSREDVAQFKEFVGRRG